jgi:hypothetical protein
MADKYHAIFEFVELLADSCGVRSKVAHRMGVFTMTG